MTRGRAILLVAAAVWLSSLPGLAAQADQRNLEYEVKAGFLRHFLTFIDWPATAFSDTSAPFRLCIVGRDPFGSQIDEVMRGDSVAGHPIRVVRLADEPFSDCHVVYTLSDSEAQLNAIRRLPKRQSVLIVGESRRLLDNCGSIAFVLEGERVRFDINLSSLSTRGLTASAKLLRVAREASTRFAACED